MPGPEDDGLLEGDDVNLIGELKESGSLAALKSMRCCLDLRVLLVDLCALERCVRRTGSLSLSLAEFALVFSLEAVGVGIVSLPVSPLCWSLRRFVGLSIEICAALSWICLLYPFAAGDEEGKGVKASRVCLRREPAMVKPDGKSSEHPVGLQQALVDCALMKGKQVAKFNFVFVWGCCDGSE